MAICSRGEMDIMRAFEALVGGSNPSGSTATEKANCLAFVRDEKTLSISSKARCERCTVPVRKEIPSGSTTSPSKTRLRGASTKK